VRSNLKLIFQTTSDLAIFNKYGLSKMFSSRKFVQVCLYFCPRLKHFENFRIFASSILIKEKSMKNLSLCILSLLLSFAGLHAQTLQIEGISGNYWDPDFEAITFNCDVRNLSAEQVSVLAKKIAPAMAPGAENFFCWTQCYGPSTIVSPAPLTIASNAIREEFHGYYKNNNVLDDVTIKYVFFLQSNPNDSVMLDAVFTPSTLGLSDNKMPILISAGPNPAIDNFSITYAQLPSKSNAENVLIIYNAFGQKVSTRSISGNEGKLNFPVNSLSNGVYFYSLVCNNIAVYSGRFIVKH